MEKYIYIYFTFRHVCAFHEMSFITGCFTGGDPVVKRVRCVLVASACLRVQVLPDSLHAYSQKNLQPHTNI